ncbi:MAG TPA: sigma-70 family RNA polymerase sigma factor [Mycobacteriales bacterium]|nr:sigma-70 family RNA polymerase sigma factor [Mycobacteriales bacterium]
MSDQQPVAPGPDIEALVMEHLGLAYAYAARFKGRGVATEDLRQVAAEALVAAARGYDPQRGVPFAGYAAPTILGRLKRYFRDSTWDVHVPRSVQELSLEVARAAEELTQQMGRSPAPSELAHHLRQPIDEVIAALEALAGHQSLPMDLPEERHPATGVDAFEMTENLHALRPLMAGLPERDRRILSLRFGAERTQSQIGAMLGISQMQVSRRLNACLAELRRNLVR